MQRKKKSDGFLERAAQAFDIPVETVGVISVELLGQHEVRISNHRGILAYGQEEILVSGGKTLVRLKGDGLELKTMTEHELLISGTILAVELS